MYELIGFRYVDIEDTDKKKDPVKGYSCWFTVEDPTDVDFHGKSAVKVFFNEAVFPEMTPELGKKYMLLFNQKGRLKGYQIMD